jgi:hypothetical protein
MTTSKPAKPADTTPDSPESGPATVDTPQTAAPEAAAPDAEVPDAAAPKAKAPKPRAPKPGIPKPGSFATPSPAVVAAHKTHPVKVPVVATVSDAQLEAASAFGVVEDAKVFVTDGDTRHEVGPAEGDTPLVTYCKAYYELEASVERFHARLSSADLSPKAIDDNLSTLHDALEKPVVVGDLAALRERLGVVDTEAKVVRERIQAERKAAKEAATAAREEIVSIAEAIAGKPEAQIHWKDDTAALREQLDAWKEAQRSGARIAKDAERALWKRFTHARSAFEKARKHHFAQLDKDNADVAARKEALAVKAESLSQSTDWDSTARAFKDLMGDWKNAGRGRRSVDDALWKRFQTAQDSFFESKRQVSEAEDAALADNVDAKEAVVKEAEALLPIKDLQAAKAALRTLQDKFEAAGHVPRGDVGRLNKRITAVEKAVRDAEDAAWTSRNPEIEARATGAAAQLHAAIADLETQLAEAKSAKNTSKAKKLQESLDARKAWLAQVEGVVS